MLSIAANLQPQFSVVVRARAAARQLARALPAADSVVGSRGSESPVTGQKAAGSPIASARGVDRARKSLPLGLMDRNGTAAAATRSLPGREEMPEDGRRPARRAVVVTSRSSFAEKFRPVGVMMIDGIALSGVRALSRASVQPMAAKNTASSKSQCREGLRCAFSPDWNGMDTSWHMRGESRLRNAIVRRAGNDCGK